MIEQRTNTSVTESPLRILMLAPTPYFSDRGCHVRIYEEARALTEAGHSVCIVTYHLGRDLPGIPVIRIPRVPWYRKQGAGPSWHKPYLDLLLLFSALRTARSFKPQIIHAHLHEGVCVGFVLKKLLKIPLIFDYQGSLSDESLQHGFYTEGSLLHRCFIRIEALLNRMADTLLTSSSAARDDLVTRWQLPDRSVTPLIDAVDTTLFKPCSAEAARKKLGIAPHATVIVYLGLMNSYQGTDLLLEALATVMAADANVHALIMGFPEANYQHKALELKIADRITFTGKIPYEQAAEYLCAGDLAVSPKLSGTEANGKLFNYMACALPAVVFDSRINREILGDSAWYAANTTASALAETLLASIADRQALQQCGAASRERALALHSWNTRVAILIQAYRRLLETYRN